MLKEENAKLRSKIVKEKEKRRRLVQEMKDSEGGTHGTKTYHCKIGVEALQLFIRIDECGW